MSRLVTSVVLHFLIYKLIEIAFLKWTDCQLRSWQHMHRRTKQQHNLRAKIKNKLTTSVHLGRLNNE